MKRPIRDPVTWWKQAQTDMRDLQQRIDMATKAYLDANSPVSRLDRLYVLQGLEKAAVQCFGRFLLLAQEYLGEDEIWYDWERKIFFFQLDYYRRRLEYLRDLYQSLPNPSTHHPLYGAIQGTRQCLRRLTGDDSQDTMPKLKRGPKPKAPQPQPVFHRSTYVDTYHVITLGAIPHPFRKGEFTAMGFDDHGHPSYYETVIMHKPSLTEPEEFYRVVGRYATEAAAVAGHDEGIRQARDLPIAP